MTFVLKDKNNQTLFTGTKQDCMHFIKRRALNRSEITLESVKGTQPALHYTVPQDQDEPNTKGKKVNWYKRIFN